MSKLFLIILFVSNSVMASLPSRSTKIMELKPATVSLETAVRVLEQSIAVSGKKSTKLETIKEQDLVVSAIDRDDYKAVAEWLSMGHLPTERIQNKIKESILERAAIRGSEKVFELLLARLEPEVARNPKTFRDNRGTPLLLGMTALCDPKKNTTLKYERMIERFLIEYSDEVNDRDRAYIGDGRTALHEAAVIGNTRLMDTLISHGAHVDSENSTGETPLHLAARFGKLGSVRLLLANGAKIDAKTKHTRATPLLVAAENGHEPIIRELLDSGAKKGEKDVFGKTAPQRFKEYVTRYFDKRPSN